MHLRPFYIALLIFLCCSCSTVFLTLKSNPSGASVYLIPKKVWDSDSITYSDPNNIVEYLIKEGTTPVHALDINEGSYVAIFILDDRKKIVKTDVDKTYRERSKVVTADF